MISAYRRDNMRLARMAPEEDLIGAIWIDLWRPQPEQIGRVSALGIDVPSFEDMEEIEISNRIYREDGRDFMTVVLPGQLPEGERVGWPVTFILDSQRLVTVRHHSPRPFETFGARADRTTSGCATPVRLFLGLVEEIISRLADLLEMAGKALDVSAARTFAGHLSASGEELQETLKSIGREGEAIAQIRLALLTVERMLAVFGVWLEQKGDEKALRVTVKALLRDIQALEVHADFLSGRLGLVGDTTLGLINLEQNKTVRIVSVVAALFLPPTLIASAYGMNFAHMPELAWSWGYPAALGLMVLSAAATWAYFKWRGWL
jgi:magnesium transporter